MTDTASIRATPPVLRIHQPQLYDRAPVAPPRVVIATILPAQSTTGVQTHVREVHRYLTGVGRAVTTVDPLSGGARIARGVFAGRVPLAAVNDEAGVMWYREWHWRFLRRALRRELADGGDAVVYAQCPL